MSMVHIESGWRRELFVDDFERTIENAVSTVRHTAHIGRDGVVRIDRTPEVLTVFEGVQTGQTKQLPRGLLDVVHRAAQQQGATITGRVHRLVALAGMRAVPGSTASGPLEMFLERLEGGILRLGPGVGAASVIARIAQTYPRAGIVVLAAREQDVRRLRQEIRSLLPRKSCNREVSKGRVAVSSFMASVDAGIGIKHADIVIVPRGRDACSEHARWALSAASQGRQFAFVGIDEQMAPRDWDWLRAVCGPTYLSVRQLDRPMRMVCTHTYPVDRGWQLPLDATLLSLRRQGIWRHAGRNRLIAELARGILRAEDPTRCVLVLVDHIEHAVELARRIPEARLRFGRAFQLADLGPSERRVISPERMTNGLIPRVLITVTDAMTAIPVEHFEVVIRADGGLGLPAHPERFTVARDNSARPLVLVDFADRHHPTLRKWSRTRREAYTTEGWWPQGQTVNSAAVNHFLNSRP